MGVILTVSLEGSSSLLSPRETMCDLVVLINYQLAFNLPFLGRVVGSVFNYLDSFLSDHAFVTTLQWDHMKETDLSAALLLSTMVSPQRLVIEVTALQ